MSILEYLWSADRGKAPAREFKIFCIGDLNMFSILWTLILGAVVGAVAKSLIPGPDPGGWIINIILGIAGSWLGNRLLGGGGLTSLTGFIAAVVGAIVLLLIYRLIAKALNRA